MKNELATLSRFHLSAWEVCYKVRMWVFYRTAGGNNWSCSFKKKTEKKQDADSLMRPFHNMSMWQGQDVVHSLGLKIKTAPLDAHTVRFGGGFFSQSHCSAPAHWCFWDSSWWVWWWNKKTEDERNILVNVAGQEIWISDVILIRHVSRIHR